MAQRFTVFDVMQSKGVFKKNPANIDSQTEQGVPLYAGPVQYPKMLFHPKGEERIIQQGEVIVTPLGPQRVMQQREIIYQIVNSAEEEKNLISQGWHTHPAKAIQASGKEAPATGADMVIVELQRKIAELQEQQAALLSVKPPEPKVEAVSAPPLTKPALQQATKPAA